MVSFSKPQALETLERPAASTSRILQRLSAVGPRKTRAFAAVVSLIALLAVWELAFLILRSRFLPSPALVAAAAAAEMASGRLFYHTGMTLMRVAASFVIALAIGSGIGIAMGRYRTLNLFFDTWLILFLNLPALIIIMLCFVWFGLNETAAVTAVALNKIPNVAVTLREGAQALSREYDEMAKVYRFSAWTTFREVHLPQLAPYFAVAARSGLAIVWKIVLVVELLGLSSGVGFQLNSFFQNFDVASILAYSLSFIAVIFLIESVLLNPWQRAASRWRP